MRAFPALALLAGLAALGPPAHALGPADAQLELDSLQRILVPQAGEPGLGQPLRELAAQPGAGAPPGGGAVPESGPAGAAGSALLWLLVMGGGVGAGLLGWRQLSLRNALDHPGRAAILGALRAHPGLHVRGVARELAMPVQHAAYHLRVLEKVGLVRCLDADAGGKRCYHDAGLPGPARDALLRAASAPTMAQRQVLAFVALHPGASQSEVARQLGMMQGAARWHLQRLVRQGRLTEQRAGKALAYRVPRGQ